MAKLKAPTQAGFNAGKNFYSKMVKVSEIVIDPEVSKFFIQGDRVRNLIKDQIEKFGFDKNQPLAVAVVGGKKFLVDGHTRLAAAKEANLEEVPVTEIEFPDFDAALMYTFERQALRRNLTGAEIIAAIQMTMSKEPKVKDGTGRQMELLAKKLGISAGLAYHAQKVALEADPETLLAVQKGDMSLTSAYNNTVKSTNDHIPETVARKAEAAAERGEEFAVTRELKLPANVKFLKSAVEILFRIEGEFSRITVIHLLIDHFIRGKEKPNFLKLLSKDIREGLYDKEEDGDDDDGSLYAYSE